MKNNIKNEINYLILKSYPLLRRKSIQIKFWKRTNKFYPMACAKFSSKKLILELNPRIRELTRKERIGLLAHELVHLEFYVKRRYVRNLLWLWNDLLLHSFILYPLTKKWLGNKHKQIDIEAIKRGYGKNLIAYKEKIRQRVDKTRIKKYYIDYLKSNEVKKIMKNN